MIPDEPFLAFTRKKDQREKITLNVGSENDLCPDSWNLIVYFSVFLQLFCAFGFFISLFVVGIVRQRMRFRFCTRKVPGRWSLHSFFDDCSHWHRKWSVWDTALFFLFLSLSSPFPLPFLSFFLSLPLLFLFLLLSFFLSFFFPFSFSFPVPFLFLFFSFFPLSFSFPFSFLFLSLSFSSPFPILSFPFLYSSFPFSLCSLTWILWSRCEASPWKRDRTKKKRMKKHLKGLGVFTTPIYCSRMENHCLEFLSSLPVFLFIQHEYLQKVAINHCCLSHKKKKNIYILTDWNLECAPFFQKSLFRKLRMQRSPGRRPDS